ncbi:MAG: DUF2029 domain-containing protein, partial [Deltaproteobacteria bacterium]
MVTLPKWTGKRYALATGSLAAAALAAVAFALYAARAERGRGLLARYYDNPECSGHERLSLIVPSPKITLDGNYGSSRQFDYCVRYRGKLVVPAAGIWHFQLDSDDGSVLFVDGRRVVYNRGVHPRAARQGAVQLAAGEHDFRLDYFQSVGDAFLRVRWKAAGKSSFETIPSSAFRPAGDGAAARMDAGAGIAYIVLGSALAAAAVGLFLLALRAGSGRKLHPREALSAFTRICTSKPLCMDLIAAAICAPFYLQHVHARFQTDPLFVGDAPYYANVVVSLLRDGDFDQGNQTDRSIFEAASPATNIDMGRSNIALGRDGTWYPKHPVLMPILSLPWYAAFGGLGLIWFNLAALLAAVAAMRRLARQCCSEGAALVAAVLVGLMPLFVTYSYSYSADVLATACVAAGLAFAVERHPLPGGMLLAAAAWLKLPNIGLLPLALVACRREHRLRMVLGALPVLALFGALNWYMFGAPWVTSYSRVLVVKAGKLAVADHMHAFNRPFWEGFELQLFHPSLGLFACA